MNDTIPTPRTDDEIIAHLDSGLMGDYLARLNLMIPFARQLERELSELRAVINELWDNEAKLKTEIELLRAATSWRPIDTAPKDGSLILAVMRGRTCIAFYDSQKYHKKPVPYWASATPMGVTSDRANQPLLWMPLPPPPTF